VTEVGRALNVSSCGLRVDGSSSESQTTKCYLRHGLKESAIEESAMMEDLKSFSDRLAGKPETYVVDGDGLDSENMPPRVVVPLSHQKRLSGLLLVRSDDNSRSWAESELLLLHTVADQVAVAINQAHLFAQLQEQALTDGLTGLYNRRAFEMQLERDLQFATRMRQPLSLIMLDLDNLKQINDRLGHEGGDTALRMLADSLRAELRAVDTPARYGGDEFAIILPQADAAGALIVAERLRERIAGVGLPGASTLTASVGLASFPEHGSSREALCLLADRALYRAKRSGRNCVCVPQDEPTTPAIFTITDEAIEVNSVPN
jgi:diguanylate cyclase (GGDEF)-like protein